MSRKWITDSPRENVFDPVNVPLVEMGDPVLAGVSVLVEWRCLSEVSLLSEFRVLDRSSDFLERVWRLESRSTSNFRAARSDWPIRIGC